VKVLANHAAVVNVSIVLPLGLDGACIVQYRHTGEPVRSLTTTGMNDLDGNKICSLNIGSLQSQIGSHYVWSYRNISENR
jgi:hypothetical protein